MKKKGSRLFASFAAPVCALLAFVGFAFKFIMSITIVGEKTSIDQFGYKDWTNILKYGPDVGLKVGTWKASQVLMFILLAILVVLAVLVVIQLFYQNKVLATVTKVVGIVTILLSIAFSFCFNLGGMSVNDLGEMLKNLSDPSSGIMIQMYIGFIGPSWIMFFGVLTGIFGLIAIKKPKEAKEAAK